MKADRERLRRRHAGASAAVKLLQRPDKSQYVVGCVEAVQQTVWNAVIPVYGDGDKSRVDVLPAFDGEQDIICLGAAVENRKVVKGRRILEPYLRMVLFEVAAYQVVDFGIATADKHERLAVQLLRLDTGFSGKRVCSGDSDHFFIAS